jgi:hypothetical protein
MHIGPPSETLRERRTLDSCGVHHGANVVHPLLQAREVVDGDHRSTI